MLVAITSTAEILDRRRIEVISEAMHARHRGNQPYHRAAELGLAEGEKFLHEYIAEMDQFSCTTIRRVVDNLSVRGCEVTTAAILLASGRKLPALGQILASHPLIHTAEGELFRDTIQRACKSLQIPILGIKERDIEDNAQQALGPAASKIIGQIASAGKSLGPPWTADHKSAALAAYLALHSAANKTVLKAKSAG